MHSIYKQGELPYLNVKMCPKCEKLVSLSEETCPHCSFSFKDNSDVKNFKEDKNDELEKKETLVEEKQENKEVVIESKAKENDLIEEIVEEKPLINPKEKFMFCDNCGAKIIGPQKYCGGCGVKVSKTICPSCSQIIDSHLLFCPLCGEKLQDPVSNVSTSNVDVTNQPIPQVSFEEENSNEILKEVKEEALINNEEVLEQKSEETEITSDKNTTFSVKIGRKRTFLIIQLIVVLIVSAVMLFVPILTQAKFIDVVIPCIKNENSSETMVTGLGVINHIIEMIKNKTFIFEEGSVFYQMVVNSNGESIYSANNFIQMIIGLFADSPKEVGHFASEIVFLVVYLFIILSLLIAVLTSIFGLFSKKKPYKGKTLGLVIVSLLVAIILVYTATFTNEFKGFDSWLLYAFALTFFLWFIVKIVFLKEVKKYNLYKQTKSKKA